MIALSKSSKTVAALAALVLPVTAGAQAQELEPQGGANSGGEPMTVVGTTPRALSEIILIGCSYPASTSTTPILPYVPQHDPGIHAAAV